MTVPHSFCRPSGQCVCVTSVGAIASFFTSVAFCIVVTFSLAGAAETNVSVWHCPERVFVPHLGWALLVGASRTAAAGGRRSGKNASGLKKLQLFIGWLEVNRGLSALQSVHILDIGADSGLQALQVVCCLAHRYRLPNFVHILDDKVDSVLQTLQLYIWWEA